MFFKQLRSLELFLSSFLTSECVIMNDSQVRLVLKDATLLDREQSDEHKLRVVAYDSGQPPRSGQLDVTVMVMDANDNIPVFEYNAYEVGRWFERMMTMEYRMK